MPEPAAPTRVTAAPSGGRDRDEPQSDDGDAGPLLDRILDGIRALPGPTWATYAIAATVVALAAHAAAWADGVVPALEADLFRMSFAVYLIFPVAALHHLRVQGVAALRRFLPALDGDERLLAELERDLRRLPPGPTIAWTAGGLLFWIGYVLLDPDPVARLGREPLAYGSDVVIALVSMPAAALLIYHTLHQLRWIGRIYQRAVRIDPFQPEPLYAFSDLTVRIGVAIALFGYFSAVTDPAAFATPVFTVSLVAMLAVACACFILPLLGIHRRLVAAKDELETEAGGVLQATLQELNRRVRAGDNSGAGALTPVLEGLTLQRAAIHALPTWPWRGETLRGFASAVVLPIGLWVTYKLLERFLGT